MSNNKNNVAGLFNGKGFYIVLFLCVAAIGISAYVVFFSNSAIPTLEDVPELNISMDPNNYDPGLPVMNPIEVGEATPDPNREMPVSPEPTAGDLVMGPSETSPAASPSPVTAPPASVTTPEKPKSDGEAPTVQPSGKPAASEPDAEQVIAAADEIAPAASESGAIEDAGNVNVTCVWPVTGGVAAAFSKDELQYDRTLGDWRVHTGLDIEAGLGTKVVAMAAGVVEDIYADELAGVTVRVSHGDDLFSVYSNLQGEPPVARNQQLKAGELLGLVGNTSASEGELKPHLHLEVINKGQQIDPLEILPK